MMKEIKSPKANLKGQHDIVETVEAIDSQIYILFQNKYVLSMMSIYQSVSNYSDTRCDW